ncbi:MAG: hypothetical protein QOJ53_1947 [Sphingomonadales bacterium]|jgi:hypothetical protein|nr:hypothetical protein [Sphingomonadales bacterium]
MKRIYLAAGALLLGTSAFAWAPSTAPVAHEAKTAIAMSDAKAPAPMLVAKSNDLPKAAAADQDLDLSVDPNKADKGMGGPLEEVTTTQAAATDYPPCRPGPGDDHCIQLYEPGVRAALASRQPSADTQVAAADTTLAGEMGAATGVGGPYEPVEEAGDLAMNGDGMIDAATGETAEVELASSSGYTGVGGPLEESAYPPCRPGPGDDRCIQLYERGVTG